MYVGKITEYSIASDFASKLIDGHSKRVQGGEDLLAFNDKSLLQLYSVSLTHCARCQHVSCHAFSRKWDDGKT